LFPTQITTAWYLEQALRKHFNVITVGENLEYNTGSGNDPYLECIPNILREQHVDFVLGVESGGFEVSWVPIQKMGVPHLWWAIDTHLSLMHHKHFGKCYEHVFLAHAAYLNEMSKTGVSCSWLPPACDPELHYVPPTGHKRCEVVFVGHCHPAVHQRRIELIDYLKDHCVDITLQQVWLKDMARAHQEAQIVLNCSLNGDLNMRMFEGLCSGVPFLTDRLAPNTRVAELGLEGLYNEYLDCEEALEFVLQFREDEAFREDCKKRALEAREAVLVSHTYANRAQAVCDIVRDKFLL